MAEATSQTNQVGCEIEVFIGSRKLVLSSRLGNVFGGTSGRRTRRHVAGCG